MLEPGRVEERGERGWAVMMLNVEVRNEMTAAKKKV